MVCLTRQTVLLSSSSKLKHRYAIVSDFGIEREISAFQLLNDPIDPDVHTILKVSWI